MKEKINFGMKRVGEGGDEPAIWMLTFVTVCGKFIFKIKIKNRLLGGGCIIFRKILNFFQSYLKNKNRHKTEYYLRHKDNNVVKKFPASVPRKMFWSTESGGKSRCPECWTRLKNEYHTYMFAVIEGSDIQPFMIGTDAGYFCAKCPTVVLDYEKFEQLASIAGHGKDQLPFTVIGLVDLDAVPEEKAGISVGDDDNPIPLVQFTNITSSRMSQKRKPSQKRRKKSRRHKKKRK